MALYSAMEVMALLVGLRVLSQRPAISVTIVSWLAAGLIEQQLAVVAGKVRGAWDWSRAVVWPFARRTMYVVPVLLGCVGLQDNRAVGVSMLLFLGLAARAAWCLARKPA